MKAVTKSAGVLVRNQLRELAVEMATAGYCNIAACEGFIWRAAIIGGSMYKYPDPLTPEQVKEISRQVARECAVIAAEADTNYDAEQEILTRFDCDPTAVPPIDHSCYHCDKPAEWIWHSCDGKELHNICQRCMDTVEPYRDSKLKQFDVILRTAEHLASCDGNNAISQKVEALRKAKGDL